MRARALSCHAHVASVARASQLIRRGKAPPSNRSHSHEHVRCRFCCCQRSNAMIEAPHRCQHDSAATAACARKRRVLRHTAPAAQHSVALHRPASSLRPVAHAHSAAQQHPDASSQRRRYPEVQRHDFLPALEREDVHTISHLISRCVADRLDGLAASGHQMLRTARAPASVWPLWQTLCIQHHRQLHLTPQTGRSLHVQAGKRSGRWM